jgi:hypothetical protein
LVGTGDVGACVGSNVVTFRREGSGLGTAVGSVLGIRVGAPLGRDDGAAEGRGMGVEGPSLPDAATAACSSSRRRRSLFRAKTSAAFTPLQYAPPHSWEQ